MQVEFEVTGDVGYDQYVHIDDVRACSATATAVRIADMKIWDGYWCLFGLMVGLLVVIRLSKSGEPTISHPPRT